MEKPKGNALVRVKKELVPLEAKSKLEHLQSTRDGASKTELDTAKAISQNTANTEQKILEILRRSLQPFSDRLDPFAALPMSLDRFQEHLVSFYLLYYPKVTYGFSPRLKPHPVASNFSIALTTPACFQVALARSALYRLTLSKYASEAEKKELEVAMMRHKGEAIKLVRDLSTKSNPKRKDDLLASMISLGTFDMRTGAQDTSGMHFMAVRRTLKVTGGPLAVNSVLLSRVMCFFECIYGTPVGSYIWDPGDLKRLLRGMNDFLNKVWELWQSLSTIRALTQRPLVSHVSAPIHSFNLQPDSVLLSLVSRQAPADAEITPQRRLELVFQLTTLLTLAMITLDFAHDFRTLQQYMDDLHRMMKELRLEGQSCNNAMWQVQVNDHTELHSRRIWRAASYAWVMKHVSYKVQLTLKEWLLKFFTGKPVDKVYRLDSYHFSYAS